jgi:hypothetical protein
MFRTTSGPWFRRRNVTDVPHKAETLGFLHIPAKTIVLKNRVCFVVAPRSERELQMVLKVKPNLPLRDGRERFHFLHLAGDPVDILDKNLNDGGRTVLSTFQFLQTGGDILV